MAQADQNVANATFPTVRADINDNLAALFSQSSGNSAPAVTVAFQPWIDTSSSPAVWKVRNAANSGWITIGTLDASTFSSGGVTAIANGGTGETTASAAINALLPAQSGNSGKALITDGTVASWDTARGLINGTTQTYTSTSTMDFTGIPNWVRRVTFMFRDFSSNGTSAYLIQLGDAVQGFPVGPLSYDSSGSNITEGATLVAGSVAGFILMNSASASLLYRGSIVITRAADQNVWYSSGILSRSDNISHSISAGHTTWPYTVDRFRITTVSGTNIFDNGTVSIMYEG